MIVGDIDVHIAVRCPQTASCQLEAQPRSGGTEFRCEAPYRSQAGVGSRSVSSRRARSCIPRWLRACATRSRCRHHEVVRRSNVLDNVPYYHCALRGGPRRGVGDVCIGGGAACHLRLRRGIVGSRRAPGSNPGGLGAAARPRDATDEHTLATGCGRSQLLAQLPNCVSGARRPRSHGCPLHRADIRGGFDVWHLSNPDPLGSVVAHLAADTARRRDGGSKRRRRICSVGADAFLARKRAVLKCTAAARYTAPWKLRKNRVIDWWGAPRNTAFLDALPA